MLDNLNIVLFKTKFPENVGSSARAMINMGCNNLTLVKPSMWDIDKALPLATAKAKGVVEQAHIENDLGTALKGNALVFGTTSRTGGWRKELLTPSDAAPIIVSHLKADEKIAIVFGPEDKGLTNDETKLCSHLINIPTSSDHKSLNLSQAVLIMVYECFKSSLNVLDIPNAEVEERVISFEEREILSSNLKETLLTIDFLKEENTDYWMMRVKRFMSRFSIRRNEFNLLMGICRQVKWIASKVDR